MDMEKCATCKHFQEMQDNIAAHLDEYDSIFDAISELDYERETCYNKTNCDFQEIDE